ncbi:MAG: YlxR family protein [Eubacteriales bacterium]|nr:YlxR family protein [Eubacteriales bacterium]
MCVACRLKADQSTFFRIVSAADGRIGINPGRALEGRSAYICKNISCYDLALKNRSLQRSLRRPVPEELMQELKELILKDTKRREIV